MMVTVLFTFLVFFLPGALFLFREYIFPDYPDTEKLFLIVPISLAYWIIGFWWLSIVPMPLTIWVYLSLGVAAVSIILSRKRIKISHAKHILHTAHIPFFLFLCVVIIPQLHLITRLVVPSGPDMSMHTYIASVIIAANRFPQSLMPIVPVDHFGIYPFGFSTIIAVLSTANGIAPYINALLLSSLAHVLFDYALYLILRSKFSPLISAIVAIIVGWTSNNPHLFIVWGANPTTLSLAFLALAIALTLTPHKSANNWLALMCISASFLTNYMFVVAATYISVPILLLMFLHSRNKRDNVIGFSKTIAAFSLITLPFIWKITTSDWRLTEVTRQFVRTFHYEETAAWAGSVSWKAALEIIGILVDATDKYLIFFFGLMYVFLFLRHRKTALFFLYITGVICLFIVNARYWWLPLSSVLYPYRTSLLILIPIAWSMALLLAHIQKRYPIVFAASLILMFGIFLPRLEFPTYLRETETTATVTRSDLSAMWWLQKNSQTDDIIWNRYQDGGLWIPAIISRPITLYHTNPVDWSELHTTGKRLPDYAFIGAAMRQELPIAEEVAVMFPEALHWRFDIVYHKGDTAIYKITR